MLLSIGEVARRADLQASALRYYERRGLIRPRSRIGGRRYYDSSVLQTLAAIALLQEVGFTIGEIGEMLARKSGGRWRALAKAKLGEIDAHLAKVAAARDLLASAVACRCSSLQRCDLVRSRQGKHGRAVQRLTLAVVPPAAGRG